MPRIVAPREAEAMLASAGDVDVVDVRSSTDWAAGHVPGARNVPLDELKSDARRFVRGDRVLFVCARGVRSLTAADAAERAGVKEVMSLDGGTDAWGRAGLPLERPAATTPAPAAPAPPGAAASDDGRAAESSCGLPEPALDGVVGANLRALRTQRNLTLDALARMTGLSRGLLGQIELGKTSPSVSVVWRIAQAFNVQFSAMLATSERAETRVHRGAQAKRLVSPDGRFSSRALYNLGEKNDAEFYELFLAAHSREDAQPHQPGTRENLIVTSGRLELHVGGNQYDLDRGDAIVFSADVPHSYVNPSGADCWMYLVMTYANRS